jgi:hypothetical protein
MSKTEKREIQYMDQPTTHTDGVHMGCRDDGSVFLQLFSDTPNKLIENHRTMMSAEAVTRVIDVLCDTLNYYPEKKSNESSKVEIDKK